MTAKGVDGAIREASASHSDDGELTPDEQAELFAAFDAGEKAIAGKEKRAWNGVGRKPGAGNVATRAVVDYITKTKRHPLVALASVVSMTPAEVRKHFGVSGKEAAKLWLKACESLAPYLASKMPQPVTFEVGEGFAPLTFVFGQGEQATPDITGRDRGDPAELQPFGEFQQNQGLTLEGQARVAHSEGRTDDASA